MKYFSEINLLAVFFRTSIAVLLILLLVYPVFGSDTVVSENSLTKILVIKSGETGIYQQLTPLLKKELNELCIKKKCKTFHKKANEIQDISDIKQLSAEYDVILTLGISAKKLFDNLDPGEKLSIIHALVPFKLAIEDENKNRIFMVLDQPLFRQLEIISELFESSQPTGILYSNESLWIIRQFNGLTDQLRSRVKFYKTENINIGQTLDKIKNEVDSIIIVPDHTLYNRVTIKQILLTGYLNKTLFIGYSTALAKAGALFSIVTDKKTIAKDLHLTLKNVLNEKITTGVFFPSNAEVIINNTIADSIGIQIRNEIKDKQFKTRFIE